MDSVERALFDAARFLTVQLGVPSDGVMPYTNQLLLMSEFFRLCPAPSDGQQDLLERWFWVTSFSGWFAGANTTQLRIAITEMHKLAKGSTEPFEVVSLDDQAQPFPLYFDMRSARVRCLLLVMLRLKPRDPQTGEAVPFQRVCETSAASPCAGLSQRRQGLHLQPGEPHYPRPKSRAIRSRSLPFNPRGHPR